MRIDERCRGRGLARTFLGIWLCLCRRGGVAPATSKIRKPLLALALRSAGFAPHAGGYAVEIAREGPDVRLYAPSGSVRIEERVPREETKRSMIFPGRASRD